MMLLRVCHHSLSSSSSSGHLGGFSPSLQAVRGTHFAVHCCFPYGRTLLLLLSLWWWSWQSKQQAQKWPAHGMHRSKPGVALLLLVPCPTNALLCCPPGGVTGATDLIGPAAAIADSPPALLSAGRVAGAGGSGGSAPAASALLPSRRTVRSGSETIKQLRDMVGNSGKIYSHLVELCEVRGAAAVPSIAYTEQPCHTKCC